MNNRFNYSKGSRDYTDAIASVMKRVYAYMCIGLLISALMSYAFATIPELYNILYTVTEEGVTKISILGLVILFSPLAILLFSNREDMSSGYSLTVFILIAALMGASLSSIFLVYTSGSIMMAFIITAGMFAITSFYGFVTNKDLSSWGNILFMALIGIIIAMLVNMFLGSEMMDYIISVGAVIVFTALTAYDTQKIKEELGGAADDEEIKRVAAWGALSLYLNFVNLMLHILRLFGQKK